MDSEDEDIANKIIYPFTHVYSVLFGIVLAVNGKGGFLPAFLLGTFIGWLLTCFVVHVALICLGAEKQSGREKITNTSISACIITAVLVPILVAVAG